MFTILKFIPKILWSFLLYVFLNAELVASASEIRKAIYQDTVFDALNEQANQLESIQRHSDIITGFGHLWNLTEEVTKSPNLSPLLQPSDMKVHHKTKPPKLGSLCDYEEYTKLFSAYYAVPFLNYAERLYEHKNIETELNQGMAQESNEKAWGLCQFGGIMMECGDDRRCRCLNVDIPYRYVQEKVNGSQELTCLGAVGSICSNDPRTVIHCKNGLNCTKGYCGGLRLAARAFTNIMNCVPSVSYCCNFTFLGIAVLLLST